MCQMHSHMQKESMSRKENFLLRLFLIFFTVSVSAAVIPCGIVTAYGLFGEAGTSVVTDEGSVDAEEVSPVVKSVRAARQARLYPVWLVADVLILCRIHPARGMRLSGRDTLVALKVRIND